MLEDMGHTVDNYTAQHWPGPWDHRLTELEAELRGAPMGLSEFDLLRRLQKHPRLPEIVPGSLSTPLTLYRTHFLLFHTLYRLDERLAGAGERVEVHCLAIRILPCRQAAGVVRHDALRAFYADRANLVDMSTQDVERLLGAFWGQFQSSNARDEALAVLGLADPVSDAEIKAAYRRLAMRHHPDRGGDGERLRAVNDALSRLGL